MAKQEKEKSIEAQLWDAANKLRGNIEASEYKHVVLSLIFLKYAGVRFERQYEKLETQFGAKNMLCEMPVSYGKDNVFYLQEHTMRGNKESVIKMFLNIVVLPRWMRLNQRIGRWCQANI